MGQLIGFFILIAILASAITGALGMYIAGEKGNSTIKGLIIGICFSIFGVIALAFAKTTDKQVLKEMYDRDMMDFEEYETRVETKTKK